MVKVDDYEVAEGLYYSKDWMWAKVADGKVRVGITDYAQKQLNEVVFAELPGVGDEVVKDEPGQAAVLDRLLDLLLIAVLRAWFARPEAEEPAWYRSQGDPIVGRALSIMHANPAHPWTVASLAAETGVSRAALARRFHDIVGEPPMTFLTGWRLALAADLLCEPDATVGSVAEQVGYSSPFALSTAFKRVRGVSPQEHRVRAKSLV